MTEFSEYDLPDGRQEHRDGLVSPLSPWAEWFADDDALVLPPSELDRALDDQEKDKSQVIPPVQRPGIYARDYVDGDPATHMRIANSFGDVIKIAERRVNMADDEFPWNSFERHEHASLLPGHGRYGRGTESLEEAVSIARYGWKDGVKRMQEIASHVKPDSIVAPDSPRPRSEFGTTGSTVSIPRAVSGSPKFMNRRRVLESNMGKSVDIVVNASYSYTKSEDEIMARGVAIAGAMQALRTSGFSTGLTLVTHSESDNNSRKRDEDGRLSPETLQYRIPVVKPGKALSDAKLIYALAHPSMLRRILFAAEEEETEALRRDFGFLVGGGYANVRDIVGNYEQDGPCVIIDAKDGFGLRTPKEIGEYGQHVVEASVKQMKAVTYRAR